MKNELNEQSWGRLKNMWQRAVTALRSRENKTMLLPAQLDYRALTVSPVDAQIIDMTKLNRSMIAGIFNVPAHMINDRKATFSNITQQAIQFVRYTMMPRLRTGSRSLTVACLPVQNGLPGITFVLTSRGCSVGPHRSVRSSITLPLQMAG